MDEKQLIICMSALLSGLNLGPCPSGMLYATLVEIPVATKGITLDQYQVIINTLKKLGLVTETGYLLSLTDKGREAAGKIDAVIARNQSKTEAAQGAA